MVGWGARGVFFNPLLGLSFFGWLAQTAFFLVLALVAAALMPGQLRGVQAQLPRRPWASLGWGALVFFIVAPATLVVLVISIIGLLLVVPYAVFLLLALFFVTTAVAAFLAQKALTAFRGKESLMLAVTVGVVGTTVVSRIPVAGPLVLVVMMVMGTGAAVLGFAQHRRARREAEAARTAMAAAATGLRDPAPATAYITPIVQTSPATQGPPQQIVPPVPPPSVPPRPPVTSEPPTAPRPAPPPPPAPPAGSAAGVAPAVDGSPAGGAGQGGPQGEE
jgi:hypothetical protein